MESGLNVYHLLKKEGQKDFDLLTALTSELVAKSNLQNHDSTEELSLKSEIQDSLSIIFLKNESLDLICFETCLRKIWISSLDLKSLVATEFLNQPEDSNSLNDFFSVFEVLKDEAAYSFLLEVLCGLKSPLIGETEVFGQFKNQVLKNLDPKNPLSKVITSIVTDTKNIRSKHLTNLGSSSYGSVARKYLIGFKSLDIIGAGQFVQSLKPWIEKSDIHTNVYTRKPEKYAKFFENSKWALKLFAEYNAELAQGPKALFVCAPVDISGIDLHAYNLVIDFRDLTVLNLVAHKNIKNLSEIFQEIQQGNSLAEAKKVEALVSVEKASQMFATSMNHRPFGWDDLSA
jgi:glutamyl-tRNA reductase